MILSSDRCLIEWLHPDKFQLTETQHLHVGRGRSGHWTRPRAGPKGNPLQPRCLLPAPALCRISRCRRGDDRSSRPCSAGPAASHAPFRRCTCRHYWSARRTGEPSASSLSCPTCTQVLPCRIVLWVSLQIQTRPARSVHHGSSRRHSGTWRDTEAAAARGLAGRFLSGHPSGRASPPPPAGHPGARSSHPRRLCKSKVQRFTIVTHAQIYTYTCNACMHACTHRPVASASGKSLAVSQWCHIIWRPDASQCSQARPTPPPLTRILPYSAPVIIGT